MTAWKQIHHPLLKATVLAYLALGVLYSVSLPILEAPDEMWHYPYVHYLATEHRLPPWDVVSPASQESSQPPLYYATAALATAWVDTSNLETLLRHNSYWGYPAAGTVNDNKNVFLHTDAETFPWRGAVLAIHVARLVNLFFGSLTVVAAYLLAREIFRELPDLAVGTAALVAFNPQFLFISAAVNNDAAAAAFSTVALWLLVCGLRRGYTLCRAILLGLSVGLAALSKVSALALLPLAVAALVLTGRQTRRWAEVCRTAVMVVLVAAAVAGWWYIRNAVVYSDPFGLKTHYKTWWAHEEPLSPAQLWAQLPGVELSFWAAFGMGNVHLPGVVYTVLRILVRLAVAGLLIWAVRAWRARHRPGARAWSLALLALWVLVVFAALLRWMQLVEAALGRLLFPAVGAIAVLLVWGLAQFVPRRFAAWPGLAFAGGLLVVATLAPWVAIGPAYARPPLLAPDEIAACARPADVRFGDGIRLVGYELERHSAHPGEEVGITLCWEATAPLAKDYACFIHFLGPAESIIGARDTHPGLGRFPTSQWTPGDAFCDLVRVPIEEWTPVPAVYGVEVGWYDPDDGERLPAYDANGAPTGLVLLDRVKVAPEEYPTVEVPNCVDASLGGQVALLGYDLSQATIRQSQFLTVTLYWMAQAPVPADYTVFVHLAGYADEPYAQDDCQPQHGTYPTSFWDVGEVVVDQHALLVPAGLPPGGYPLLVGMYLLETGERLPAFGAQGARLPGDAILLTEVEVGP